MLLFPLQAKAGLLSSILGSKASASIDAASTGDLYKNSQNMVLPEANVSFAAVIENKNKNKKKEEKKEDVIDPDAAVILDDSSTALVPNLGLGGSDDISDSDSDQISFYTVHAGDTWSGIAEMYGVTVNTVLWANDKKQSDKLVEGNILLIPPISGIEHTVKTGQTCQSLAKMYKVEASDIAEYNNLGAGCVIKSGDELFIPNAVKPEEAPVKKSTSVAKKNNAKNYSGQKLSGYFINPLSGARKSQGLHDNNAVDLAISTGTPIHASAAGTVSLAKNGYNGGFGNLVIINHSNGTQTLYAHQSKLNVTTGEQVTQGQVIGYVGSTGKSTGPHLHFEVHGAHNPGLDNSWAK